MTESAEVTGYFKEIFKVLCVQESVLSVSGLNMGRSKFSQVQELTIDTLKLLSGEEILYEGMGDERVDLYDFFAATRKKLDEGEVTFPEVDYRARELLTPLRVVYHWLWAFANREDGYGRWADTLVGKPVEIVGRMLDPLVDQEEALGKWVELEESPEDFKKYFERFRLRVKDELHPIDQWTLDQHARYLSSQDSNPE